MLIVDKHTANRLVWQIMARIMEPTKKQERRYAKWVASRPPHVRAVAERFDPWSLYRLKTSDHRVTVVSFGEELDDSITLTVHISAEFNFLMFERQVFGIKPDDLEPCDIPDADEVTGAMLTSEQVDKNIDALRVMVRPDLFAMDENGKAVKKQ